MPVRWAAVGLKKWCTEEWTPPPPPHQKKQNKTGVQFQNSFSPPLLLCGGVCFLSTKMEDCCFTPPPPKIKEIKKTTTTKKLQYKFSADMSLPSPALRRSAISPLWDRAPPLVYFAMNDVMMPSFLSHSIKPPCHYFILREKKKEPEKRAFIRKHESCHGRREEYERRRLTSGTGGRVPAPARYSELSQWLSQWLSQRFLTLFGRLWWQDNFFYKREQTDFPPPLLPPPSSPCPMDNRGVAVRPDAAKLGPRGS